MSTSSIACPHCKKPIALDEVYSQQIRDQVQKEYEASKIKLEQNFARKGESWAAEKQLLYQTADKRVAEETARARQEAERRVTEKLALEREMDQKELAATKSQALDAKQKEMDAIQKLQAAEERQQKLEIERSKAEQEIRRQKQLLDAEKASLNELVDQRVAAERPALKAQIEQEAQKKVDAQSKVLQTQVEEMQISMTQARERELEALKKARVAEEKAQTVDLEVQRQVSAQMDAVRQKTTETLQEAQHLKDLQNEREKEALRKTIDEMKRRMDQGSQQTQGETLEVDLEQTLRAAFPMDKISEVPKGQKGADVLQKVYNSVGQYCGTILWESKRTKAWSEQWIGKLKDDQAAVQADVAMLLTIAMPKGHTTFTQMSGVVVTSYGCHLPVAAMLRRSVIHVANAKATASAGNEVKELVYNYITSNGFTQHVQAILDVFRQQKKQVADERLVLTKQLSLREKQIEKAQLHIAGFYGDIQGLAGSSIPTIEGLELKALKAPDEEVASTGEQGAAEAEIPF